MSKQAEFYVDERTGCIAVRKRVNYRISPGCHEELPDVVAFWSGDSTTFHGDDVEWNVATWQQEKAKRLCELLNGDLLLAEKE